MSARDALAEGLRTWRRDAGLTQEQAAASLKVDPSQLSRWENGKQLPKAQRCREIARAYRIDKGHVSEMVAAAHEEEAAEATKALTGLPALARRVDMLQAALDEILRRLPPAK